MKNRLRTGAVALAMVLAAAPVLAEPYPRVSTAVGSVIARKSGEEVRFVDLPPWRPVEVSQDLLPGDTLRTNASGTLAILFSDSTQMRMGRNTTLVVRRIETDADSEVELQGGSIWARARRGGNGLIVNTAAAAAAIRGTDWTLRVDGDRTTLTVLEGSVTLSNPQGSVVVNPGEGAVAAIGQAPNKYTLVDLQEREQILLYGELRDVFSSLPASTLGGPAMRGEHARVLALSEAVRTDADWLSLAETALTIDGRQKARDALSRLRRPLAPPLEARARLVEAMIAGQETRYREAERLFAQAIPALPADRRATAAYGRWFAAALADPAANITPPADPVSDPTAALAHATLVAHVDGTAAAIDVLRQAERRFPDDARLPAMRASFAFALDRRDEVREALERARLLDPDDPSYLLMSARFRAAVSSDLDGALADLRQAVRVAPGDDVAWNELGIVYHDRNAPIEANDAYATAITLNPENAALHANYARFLMDNDQLAAAKRQIDMAEKLDATSYAVLAAKGRYLLRMGRTEEGEQVLLQASAVNPTYGDALIGEAIASYQLGSETGAAQALDNADRFDPDTPSIPLIRSGIALDQYRADEAIVEAREALRRQMDRGGFYTGYDANRQASSFLGVTLKNLGLDDWGRYYADRGADPFMATTYLDEASNGRLSPFVGEPLNGVQHVQGGSNDRSAELQGLLLDPLAIASEQKRNSIERRSFFEAAIGGGLGWETGSPGWNGNVLVQGTSYAGLPVSYYLQGEISRPNSERDNDTLDLEGATFQIGLRPTLADSIVLFGDTIGIDRGYPGQVWLPTLLDENDNRSQTIGAAWSHTLGDRSVLQAFAAHTAFRGNTKQELDFEPFLFNLEDDSQDTAFGVSHLLGFDALTLRYGVEAVTSRYDQHVQYVEIDTGAVDDQFGLTGNSASGRTYIDATYDFSKNLQTQAGLYLNWFDEDPDSEWGRADPRFGVAWAPVQDHWLRAYFRQDTQLGSSYTLSPISTVGLTPLELPLFLGGQTQTAAVRWDAEWNERFFTAVEYQHQRFAGLTLDVPDLMGSYDTSSGNLDRLHLSANYWVGGGLGLFGAFTWNQSRDTTSFLGFDEDVPLVPDYVGRIGLTYVHPSRIQTTVAQTFVGSRVGAQSFSDSGDRLVFDLEPYSTTDAAVTWKSPSGELELGLLAQNIFNADIEMAYGIPAPGRTLLATVTARF